MVSDLRKVQNIELDMLQIFHSICDELDLQYYALGGTLLGAVRHGGFIPWDDDIDLGMPRKDYEKFLTIAPDYFQEEIKVVPNVTNLNILQLVNTKTKVQLGKVTSGVFVDIFPLDGYPNEGIRSFIHDKHILFYRMLCKLSVIDILSEHDRGFIENTLVRLTKLTHFNKVLNSEKLLKKLHLIIQKYDYDTSSRVGNVLGRYRSKEIVDKKFFGDGKELKFESIIVHVPEEETKYLTQIYGDFMKLPPREEQIAHDIKIVNLGEKKDG